VEAKADYAQKVIYKLIKWCFEIILLFRRFMDEGIFPV